MNNFPDSYDPDYPYPPILDGEAMPDPSWEYYQVWTHSFALLQTATHLMSHFDNAEAEERHPKVDQAVRDHIRQITAQSRKVMELLG
jgi:hypothetical protein